MAHAGPAISEAQLLALFDKIDTDKSGTLSLKELDAAYAGKGFTPEEIKVVLYSLPFSCFILINSLIFHDLNKTT